MPATEKKLASVSCCCLLLPRREGHQGAARWAWEPASSALGWEAILPAVSFSRHLFCINDKLVNCYFISASDQQWEYFLSQVMFSICIFFSHLLSDVYVLDVFKYFQVACSVTLFWFFTYSLNIFLYLCSIWLITEIGLTWQSIEYFNASWVRKIIHVINLEIET